MVTFQMDFCICTENYQLDRGKGPGWSARRSDASFASILIHEIQAVPTNVVPLTKLIALYCFTHYESQDVFTQRCNKPIRQSSFHTLILVLT